MNSTKKIFRAEMALPYFDLPDDVRHLVTSYLGDEPVNVYAELDLDPFRLAEELYFLGIDRIDAANRELRIQTLSRSPLCRFSKGSR